jgi:hypothetical protein
MAPSGDKQGDAASGRSCSGSEGEARGGPLEVDLGAYCAEAVEALAKSGRCDADAAATEAVRAYLAAVASKPELRIAAELPPLDAVPTELSVELDLGARELDRLESEAAAQDASIPRLVEQAVIAAYAELDRRRS